MNKRLRKKPSHQFPTEIRDMAEELFNELKSLDFGRTTSITITKNNALKVKMYKEPHSLPHIHIDYVNGKDHVASYSLSDGTLLKGKLPSKYNKKVMSWIGSHKDELVALWDTLQEGLSYEEMVSEIKQLKPCFFAKARNRSIFHIRAFEASHLQLSRNKDCSGQINLATFSE